MTSYSICTGTDGGFLVSVSYRATSRTFSGRTQTQTQIRTRTRVYRVPVPPSEDDIEWSVISNKRMNSILHSNYRRKEKCAVSNKVCGSLLYNRVMKKHNMECKRMNNNCISLMIMYWIPKPHSTLLRQSLRHPTSSRGQRVVLQQVFASWEAMTRAPRSHTHQRSTAP